MLRCALSALLAIALLPAAASAHGFLPAPLHGHPRMIDHGDVLKRDSDRGLQASEQRRALMSLRTVGAGAPVGAAAPVTTELAATWCGTPTSVDDTANASSTGARIKLIYAVPSDRPSRFSSMADVIQGDAQAIAGIVADAAQGTRTVRFDTGTSCGPQYVDIISVTLPRTRAEYLAGTVGTRTDMLQQDLAPALASVSGTRDALVYADYLYGGDGIAGYASFWQDDRPGPINFSNHGGMYGFVFGNGTDAFVNPRRTSVLHELSHTLGAVQDSAPHATGAGHCTDQYDVMCYADGGPNNVMSIDCGSPTQSAFDCGANDYFAVAPPAGSYLALHWNLYNSVFLCPVGSCVAGAPAQSAPPPGTLDPAPSPAVVDPPAAVPPPVSTAPTPPVPAPAPTADPTGADPASSQTLAERAAVAVRRTRDALRAALRHHGLRPLKVSFASPAAGRIEITVTRRGRRVAGMDRIVRRGTARLQVALTSAGRHAATASGRVALSVTVHFAPIAGAAVDARGSAVAGSR